MPPKRRVPARRASNGKKVSIGGTTVIPMPVVTAPGRPKRSTAAEVDYKSTPSRAPNGSTKKQAKSSQDVPAPKAAAAATVDTPKRRGRPPKAAAPAPAPAPALTSPKATAATASPIPVKAARGRPKKTATVAAQPSPKSPKRKRDAEEPEAAPAKKRGRPAKVVVAIVEAVAPKKRGRPPKVETAPTANAKTVAKPNAAVKPTAKPVAKRGRPPGSTNKSKTAAAVAKPTKTAAKAKNPKESIESEDDDFVESLTQNDEQDDLDLQYWLMKAEPNTRIEKGIDVAYPIDKLAQATEPEPWDGEWSNCYFSFAYTKSLGVRSPVARNNMRAMRKNDLAFFYHSNCDVPGIVGVMRVVEEHTVDESAFDPAHPYFDEKSDRSKPKWDCVKVEFVKKFNETITLKELKSTPELSTMQVAQKAFGRLSVQKVTPAQWQFVLRMANEPEDLGVTSPVSGYEADTNGETDKEIVDETDGADDIDAENLVAAYGGLDDPLEDMTKSDDVAHVEPETNGFSVSAHGSEAKSIADLGKTETRVSGNDSLSDDE